MVRSQPEASVAIAPPSLQPVSAIAGLREVFLQRLNGFGQLPRILQQKLHGSDKIAELLLDLGIHKRKMTTKLGCCLPTEAAPPDYALFTGIASP
ncbi:hypothetical protein Synpcc7942_2275 [Synechococcus elongatus PCC 7942 = FACHB-805]|uniref:Uncharacterized protein n=1 Tax=Synechococcus elongatus (strain ATCC 33912 / PCC 7942 / FACHB-805) TaxID=1140 RepID=Q31KW4_SYNE7|nr:hypothetical protein Synpcc7942_2275 [Synechococcus elongatus PCC 7942 = FACHB-805]